MPNRTRRHITTITYPRRVSKDTPEDELPPNSLLSVDDFEGENDLIATRDNLVGVCLVVALNTVILMLVMWQTSRLFSKVGSSRLGFAKKYMNGGGWWILLSALIGNGLGCFVGYMLNYSVLALGFSFMILAVSFLLVGSRAMIIGGISGAQIGAILGVIRGGSMSSTIVHTIFCFCAGFAIGYFPIFPYIKINSRYIDKSLKYRSPTPSNLNSRLDSLNPNISSAYSNSLFIAYMVYLPCPIIRTFLLYLPCNFHLPRKCQTYCTRFCNIQLVSILYLLFL
ncbi:conserved hypothetical protein [Theileria orientalis strain Shintoku]|uniref:Uncharacterized protein n=1 Tax=Theileria orientalis strain Shintoku TaxID=869250 RepID=J4C885_THEOR|nr:conserved hypothetical protein [Theileria orientalis strain Shintoku]BAM40348.1 conserved hypothetical protein [Theileria orientalis strain Shintoku]|eukprot:XP_009690649.1 conserved hypothetical protein [Theileria orientalis strain Shintoku]